MRAVGLRGQKGSADQIIIIIIVIIIIRRRIRIIRK